MSEVYGVPLGPPGVKVIRSQVHFTLAALEFRLKQKSFKNGAWFRYIFYR